MSTLDLLMLEINDFSSFLKMSKLQFADYCCVVRFVFYRPLIGVWLFAQTKTAFFCDWILLQQFSLVIGDMLQVYKLSFLLQGLIRWAPFRPSLGDLTTRLSQLATTPTSKCGIFPTEPIDFRLYSVFKQLLNCKLFLCHVSLYFYLARHTVI